MADPFESSPSRTAQIGLGVVDRYLPGRHRRLVGPWCFLDVFGHHRGENSGVGPHPHIGIQTATWLFAGRSTHRDSIGSAATVAPGALSLMTAGTGIAHAEEPPGGAGSLTVGAQLWIALPEAARFTTPTFALHEALPSGDDHGTKMTLFAGSLAGASAPGRFFSPIVGAELRLARSARFDVVLDPDFEHAIVAIEGDLSVDGTPVELQNLLYVPPSHRHITLSTSDGACALLLGGEPFEELILMWWNFVARTHEEIAMARADWEQGRRFGSVEGSSLTRIAAPPLPALHLRPRPRVA